VTDSGTAFQLTGDEWQKADVMDLEVNSMDLVVDTFDLQVNKIWT